MTVGELIEKLKKVPYPDRVLVDEEDNLINSCYCKVYSPELKKTIECKSGMENYGFENVHMVCVLSSMSHKVSEENLCVREEREKAERLKKACQNPIRIGNTIYAKGE